MKLHELSPAQGSTQSPRRLGRGIGSGLGKTSGKGHKGAKARSGGGKGLGFEGGQLPLIRRVPKRGFTNIFKKQYSIVNIKWLDNFAEGTEITPELLIQHGFISKVMDGVKILGDGDISKALTVRAHKFTESAKQKIEAAGGKAEVI